MAYKLTRSNLLQEELELTDSNGKTVEKLQIVISPDKIAAEVSKQYLDLLHMQERIKAIPAQADKGAAIEELGNMVVTLLRTLIGVENTEKILSFFDGNYAEMSRNIIPYVTRELIPKVRKAAAEARKTTHQAYNRKQRRAIFKRLR